MSRRQKDPLRALGKEERRRLGQLSQSRRAPAAEVGRARALLAVAEGQSYTMAAHLAGRRNGEREQRRILTEIGRPPDRERDGTATWSLSTLRTALRRAPDGLPGVSTHTIGRALHAGGFSWQKSRTWCETGTVMRKRGGTVIVTDPDAAEKRG